MSTKRARRATPVPTSTAAPARRDGIGTTLFVALGVILALRVLAAFSASNWLWGVDSLSYWQPAAALGLAVLAALGFLPVLSRPIGRWLQSAGEFWERGGRKADVAVAALGAAVIFVLRDSVRFTGDFGVRAGLVGMQNPGPDLRLLMFPADSALNYYLARAIADLGLAPQSALQLVGAVTGGLFVFAACRFVRAAGARGAALPVALLAVCGGAVLIHFAGYNKFGPLLLGLAIAALGAVQLRHTRGGLGALATGSVLCVLSHRSGYLIIPAVLLVLYGAWRTAQSSRRRREVGIAAAIIGLAGAALLPYTWAILTRVDVVKHLPGGDIAQARGAASVPLGVLKFTHMLNGLSFLAPLWIAGLAAAAAMARSRDTSDPGGKPSSFGLGLPSALAIAGLLAMLLIIEPGGGLARDWDIATGAGVTVALATAYVLTTVWKRSGARGTVVPAFTLVLAITVATWGLHVSEEISLRRLGTMASAKPEWSDARRGWMLDFWGMYEYKRGDYDSAVDLLQRSIEVGGPNPRLFHQMGRAHLAAGRIEEAREGFRRAAEGRPQAADPWVGLAMASLAEGNTLQAMVYLDSALTRDPEHPEALHISRRLLSGR
jgi:hypothetical protein